MHPLIAFFAFIFSPSDDWALKQAFELFINPPQITVSADQVHQLAKNYPTAADPSLTALWAEVLRARGEKEAAEFWLAKLDRDPALPPGMRDELTLKLGEAAFQNGHFEEARARFEKLTENPEGPCALDAQINLVSCALAAGESEHAQQEAQRLTDRWGQEPGNTRSYYPLGLAAYDGGRYESAARYFRLMGDDPRADYFLGLSLKKLGQQKEALTAWTPLLRTGVERAWRDRARFEIAELYFALGDDPLSRVAYQKLNDDAADTRTEFRLATLDMRAKKFESALARLEKVSGGDNELEERKTTLMAEAMTQTGRSKELLAMLAKRPDKDVRTIYETTWAGLFEKHYEKCLAYAERGLEKFYDPEFTPRLLLLQALAYEHLGDEAEALATYQTLADRFPNTPAAAYSAHWTTLAYMRVGRPMEAVTHGAYLWNKIPEPMRREQPDTAFWLGEAHLKLQRFDDADRRYDEFVSNAKPDNALLAHGLFQRSVTLARLNRANDAMAMLDRFSKTASDQQRADWIALAHLQRGNVLFNDKRFPEAVVAYRAAGDQPKSLYQHGAALYRMEYYSDATAAWTKLAATFPQDAYAEQGLFRAGRTQFELGAATSAVRLFAQFAEQYPQSRFVKTARLQSAHALYNAGDIAGAAPLYADYLARYPTTEDLSAVTPYLASCYARLGKGAVEMATLLKGLPPTDELAAARWTTGADMYNQKHFADADLQFASLLAEIPTDENASAAHFYRGESLFLAGQWKDAANVLDAFVKLHADKAPEQGPLAMFHRGIAYFNQDKLLKAAGSFEELVNRYPDDKLAADAKQNMALCYHSLGDFATRDAIREKYRLSDEPAAARRPAVVAQNTDSGVRELPPGSAPAVQNEREVAIAQSTDNAMQ